MNSRDFCYWLQGLFELGDPKMLDEKQTSLIKRHLHMVFEHEIDPSFGEDQELLQEIHSEEPKPDVAETVKAAMEKAVKSPTPRPVGRPGVSHPSDPFRGPRRITC